jgi:anion-transporting  ArsA/GET3 family ATPase
MNTDQIQQEIIFVTGKGGVGKSSVAAALALKAAESGKKTLLVELGNQSFFQDFFGIQVSYKPVELKKNLDVALWSGSESLREYALHLLKVERLYKLFMENAVTKSLINIAPGLSELSILGKITSHIRKVGPQLDYDCLVVDSFATGHFLALLSAPRGMAQAIRFGPMGEQSKHIDQVLQNKDICKYFVVALPEELPVQEAEELKIEIQKLTGQIPQQVLNRCLPDLSDTENGDVKLSGFQNFMSQKMIEQNRLEKTFQPKYKLPFVFSTEAWEIVQNLAKALS